MMGLSLFFAFCYFSLPAGAGESIPEVICSPKKCYSILGSLGEGAFGKVYLAKDSSGAHYAIKCYKKTSDRRDFYLDPKREYEIGRQLNHPNIIRSYEYFSATSKGKSMHYLVLQYVDGDELYRYPKGCMNLKETFNAFDRLLSALIHALSCERVHLDLHYGNLMLNQDFEIMVIDLASFFNFDEIHDFFSTKVIKKAPEKTQEKMIKEMKIEQFFSKNPLLFEKLHKIYQEHDLEDIEMKRKVHDHLLLSYLTYYFDRITEVCVQIVLRSDLGRDERMNLRTKIKRAAWNYDEDADEGIDQPLLYYIQKLKQLTKSLVRPS